MSNNTVEEQKLTYDDFVFEIDFDNGLKMSDFMCISNDIDVDDEPTICKSAEIAYKYAKRILESDDESDDEEENCFYRCYQRLVNSDKAKDLAGLYDMIF